MTRDELMPEYELMPEFSPLGDCGIRIVFGGEISPAVHDAVRRLGAALDAQPVRGMTEWVGGYAVLTVYYQPWDVSYDLLCAALRQRLRRLPEADALPKRHREIPVCYGGEFGPDLEEVAAHCGCSAAQVIQKHTEPHYRVYFFGFLPGFAYLGGLPPSLAVLRRVVPRHAVPAGAVGIAGEQTGVYPLQTPGGWQIIGQTPLSLFDPEREPPSWLALGDRVKFAAIGPDQFRELKESRHAPD